MSKKSFLSVSEFEQLNSSDSIHIKGMGTQSLTYSQYNDASEQEDNSESHDRSEAHDDSQSSDMSASRD